MRCTPISGEGLGQPLDLRPGIRQLWLDPFVAHPRPGRRQGVERAPYLATVLSFMIVAESTPARGAASAMVASWRSGWTQISYFS
jgi:hypothetical protein